jgi:hypothetical protein
MPRRSQKGCLRISASCVRRGSSDRSGGPQVSELSKCRRTRRHSTRTRSEQRQTRQAHRVDAAAVQHCCRTRRQDCPQTLRQRSCLRSGYKRRSRTHRPAWARGRYHQCRLARIEQLHDGVCKPCRQIVEYNDIFACSDKGIHGDRADVSGAACHEHAHGCGPSESEWIT